MKELKITLNEYEVKIAKFMGKARFLHARKNGVYNDRKADTLTNKDLDEQGFAAEMAFCKLCNIYPNFIVGGDDLGIDCVLKNAKIDVKQTSYVTGHLVVKGGKETDKTEKYVLVVGTIPTFTYKGWASSKTIFQEKYKKNDPKKGISYWVPQSDLTWELPIEQCKKQTDHQLILGEKK